MKKLLLMLLVMMPLFAGCMSFDPPTPKTYKFENTRNYNQKFDDIWNRLVRYCNINGAKIIALDKNSGLVQFSIDLATNDTICDCGGPWTAYNCENTVAKIGILVNKRDENNLNVEITAKYKYVYPSTLLSPFDCNSTGKLEKEIFDYLEQGDKLPKN